MDGTISGRGSLINPPLVKNVIAKTGSLKGVYNLAGFMTNARGEKVASFNLSMAIQPVI